MDAVKVDVDSRLTMARKDWAGQTKALGRCDVRNKVAVKC